MRTNQMKSETYDHIVENLGKLDICLTTGAIRNRKAADHVRGYQTISLKGKTVLVHHVVAIAKGLDPREASVNHKDGNKKNNAPWNLEVADHTKNMRHARKQKKWEPTPRLKKEEVLEIRELLAQGLSTYEIGERYGKDSKCISDIRTGRTWRNVK
jgi:hypothetical protein